MRGRIRLNLMTAIDRVIKAIMHAAGRPSSPPARDT